MHSTLPTALFVRLPRIALLIGAAAFVLGAAGGAAAADSTPAGASPSFVRDVGHPNLFAEDDDEAHFGVRRAAASSFIGMGSQTGTPTGDILAAIRPVLRPLPVPERVQAAHIDSGDLFNLPVAVDLRRTIRIGIQETLAGSRNALWLAYTAAELKHAFGRKAVEILWLDDNAMKLGIQSRQLDFVLTDADLPLLTRESTVEPIATFEPIEAKRAEDAQAGVVFMRKTNKAGGEAGVLPTHAIEHVRGAEVAVANPRSFAGWLAPLGLMQQKGFQSGDLISQTTFYGGELYVSALGVLNAVRSGEQTVGVLPACMLEALQSAGRLDIEQELVILNPQPADSLRCAHSTPTYPGWSFSASVTMDPNLKKAMSALLFSMQKPQYGGQWALPALNRSIFDLFYELKIGPYEDLAEWSFSRFMRQNAEVLALLLLATFIVISYVVSLSVIVRRKTKELREALALRDVMEAEAAQSRQHIANLERTGIVGQMSTIIAHELKQPLSAITNYASSLSRRTKSGRYDQEAFAWALGEIVTEAERASEIVNRVRAYAKHDYPPRTVTDLSVVVQNAITTFRRSRQTKADIIVRVNPHSMAEVDAWEIELMVLNLLKNAADATSGVFHPVIEVSLAPQDLKTWALAVGDNGPYLSDEALERFFKPLQTTKGANGMGLGLSIVASIAERHAGRITVERNGARGVKFTFTFPRLPEPDEKLEDVMLPPKLDIRSGEAEGPSSTAASPD